MIQNEIKTELYSSTKPTIERILSNASTFCSLKEKESEEFKSDNIIKTIINSRRNSHTYPKNKLRKKINIFNLNIEPKVYFKSKDEKKTKNKKTKEKEKEKINKIKVSEKPKKLIVNNSNIKSTKVVNRIKISELYSQTHDLTCMKKQPPKLPDIFYHEHNINNISQNNSYGELYKGTIGNVFYSHLMTFNYKKKKLIKTCVTQRNQKKLLTIIYYKSNE